MNPTSETFYSNGKLLLTGEYVVLDGALSLALPTKFGQSLHIEPIGESIIDWKSFDEKGRPWLEETFHIVEAVFPFTYEFSSFYDDKSRLSDEAQLLLKILFTANQMNCSFLDKLIDTHEEFKDSHQGFKVTTNLNFPIDWGLGTSSTIINNIANWANIDAYELLAKTFGGSGYDIACAKHNLPITYQLVNDKREIQEVDFYPVFKENLFFVYLNKKQNSREGIANYKSKKNNYSSEIARIGEITLEIIRCKTLEEFEVLLEEHEQIIANIIQQKTIKELLFSDFEGCVKSLGAWGGDFVMVTSRKNPSNYFKSKGFETIIGYSEMIK